MRVGIPKELSEGERRVALLPDLVRTLRQERQVEVLVGTGAGEAAGYSDEDYESAGAEIVWDEEVWQADLLLCVNAPSAESIRRLTESGRRKALIGQLDPWADAETIGALAEAGVTAFSMEAVPRTDRTIDSNSALAPAVGYAAIMLAARESFPLFSMLTGDAPPARVLVLGPGPSCLQALLTARRLGAIATGCDADDTGGSIREWIAERAGDLDVIITAVAVTGRPAPLLISADTVSAMAPESVIVDLAAASGGNCELTRAGKTVIEAGVKVLGPLDIAAELPVPSSRLYAQSIEMLVGLLVTTDGELGVDLSDDIIAAACITDGGAIRHKDGGRAE
jgi:H+-translocating NAD(P) transhydrogenase subunit alpha